MMRAGPTRRAIMGTNAVLFVPRQGPEEVRHHIEEIASRARASVEDLLGLLEELLQFIVLVPDDVLDPHWAVARRALSGTDLSDAPFLAAALGVGADAIWSHDKDFDVQDLVPRLPQPSAGAGL